MYLHQLYKINFFDNFTRERDHGDNRGHSITEIIKRLENSRITKDRKPKPNTQYPPNYNNNKNLFS